MMMDVLDVSSIKELEAKFGQTDPQGTWPLMVAAANSFVRHFLAQLTSTNRVLILAGNGNNGGDGYFIGKLLIDEGFSPLLVNPLGEPAPTLDASKARRAFLEAGGIEQAVIPNRDVDIVVDSLFGSGLTRPLSAELIELIGQINRLNATVFAVDIPSGLHAESGLPMPVAIKANATHAFVGLKAGLLTNEGPVYSGAISLDTLGLTSAISAWRYQPDVTELPIRTGSTHKAKHGQVLVIGGQGNMPGAGLLAAKSALYAGAGRVSWYGERQHLAAMLMLAPELMFADSIRSEQLLRSFIVLGPGLGLDAPAQNLVWETLQLMGTKGVLDADALRILAQEPRKVPGWVLTPHEAEAAALLDCSIMDVHQNRTHAVLALAKKYNTVVVLKGAGTLVGCNDQIVFCHTGSPAMATPGMGDCLAGMIASLMAQGLNHQSAAVTAVNWHAQVGAGLATSQRVVLATDVIERLKDKR